MNPILPRFTLSATLLSGIAFCLLQNVAAASAPQQQSVNQDPPIFSRVVEKPTNNNGYEEFVQSADLIRDNNDIDQAVDSGATLQFKRHVLAMPACSKALELIREGLAKQVKSPRASFDENTTFPELSLFRKLARLLATEQYVDFADGRGDAAVESMRVGLAFGYRIQTDTIISGLVGIAISSVVSHEFAAHFEQLSIYQCDDVVTFARQMLAAGTPGASVLQNEKVHALQMLDKRKNDPKGMVDILGEFGASEDPSERAAYQALKSSFAGSGGGAASIIADAESKMSAMYDQAAANLRLPISEQIPVPIDKSNTPAATLCRLVTVDPQRIVDRYTVDQAKIRLLAVHALIRRYQWDHNALPSSLTELHADDLIVNLFTGRVITYKRDVDRYTLTSAGPLKEDDTTGAPTTDRTPVKLR